jgi:peroxiredoxin
MTHAAANFAGLWDTGVPAQGALTQTELNLPHCMKLSPKIIFAGVLGVIVAACVGVFVARPAQGNVSAPEVGYVLLDGSKKLTSDFRGDVVLVNFWATSCAVCVAEMPMLVATHQKFQSLGFTTLAVAMQYDPPSYVVNYAETRKVPFPVAIDNTGAIARAWGDVAATPTTFLVDRQGKVVRRYVGEPDFPELHRQIEGLLKGAV